MKHIKRLLPFIVAVAFFVYVQYNVLVDTKETLAEHAFSDIQLALAALRTTYKQAGYPRRFTPDMERWLSDIVAVFQKAGYYVYIWDDAGNLIFGEGLEGPLLRIERELIINGQRAVYTGSFEPNGYIIGVALPYEKLYTVVCKVFVNSVFVGVLMGLFAAFVALVVPKEKKKKGA